MNRKQHELKIIPEYFEAIAKDEKTLKKYDKSFGTGFKTFCQKG